MGIFPFRSLSDEGTPLRSVSPARPAVTGPSHLDILLVCLFTVGPHFGMHALSSLLPPVVKRLDISMAQAGLIFSAQELPGVFLPVLGGVCLSVAGVRFGRAAVLLAGLVALGQLLTAMAIQYRSYAALITAQFLFGAGNGLLVVVQSAIIGSRFRNLGVSSAFGLMLFSSRFSSYAGLSCPKLFADSVGLVASLYAVAAVCLVSFLAAIVFACVEGQRDGDTEPQAPKSAPALLREIYSATLQLPIAFWLVVVLWGLLASSTFTFLHFAAAIAESSSIPFIAANTAIASAASAGVLLLSGILSPAVGLVQDQVGHRLHLLGASFCLSAGGLLLGAYATISDFTILYVASVSALAAGFACAPVTLMSCVALIVEASHLPAALALYKSGENLILSFSHWASGNLRDVSGSYTASLLFLASMAGLGIPVIYGLSRTQEREVLTGAPAPGYASAVLQPSSSTDLD